MTTPAAAVLSHELTRERGDNSRDLLAVSWETEDQFLQLVTSGEELRPRRFGDLQPRLHVCKTCRVQNKKVTGPGKTCRVQNKKVPGLGKNMPCARNKGSWSREKHAVCKTKRFLVSEQTCRVRNKMVPGLGKTCRVQETKVPGLKKTMPRAKNESPVSKNWCSAPQN
jgi:hypothetical protein